MPGAGVSENRDRSGRIRRGLGYHPVVAGWKSRVAKPVRRQCEASARRAAKQFLSDACPHAKHLPIHRDAGVVRTVLSAASEDQLTLWVVRPCLLLSKVNEAERVRRDDCGLAGKPPGGDDNPDDFIEIVAHRPPGE